MESVITYTEWSKTRKELFFVHARDAARPSMGKTAFALNIAEHVAVQEGLPVAVFSMEMGASQLARRVIGSLGL
jgi:replicative DNA helicase